MQMNFISFQTLSATGLNYLIHRSVQKLLSMSLDFRNIPGEMLSGVDTDELEWLESESTERFIKEMDPSFINMLNTIDDNSMPRDISMDIDNELNKLEQSLSSKSTKQQESIYVNKFKAFLSDNKLPVCTDFEKVPSNILNNYLRFFMASWQKKMMYYTHHRR